MNKEEVFIARAGDYRIFLDRDTVLVPNIDKQPRVYRRYSKVKSDSEGGRK